MLYGEEKTFHMSRSILPSKARRVACWRKQRLHRQARRQISQICHRLLTHDWEEIEDDLGYQQEKTLLRQAVYDRREQDKLNHFQHWAISSTDGSSEERWAQIKPSLPNTLIGWHARKHLLDLKEFSTPELRKSYPVYKFWLVEEKYWAAALAQIVLTHHAEFNAFLKKKHVNYIQRIPSATWGYVTKVHRTRPRLLLNHQDIPHFLEDIKRANIWTATGKGKDYHPEWQQATHDFINASRQA